MPKLIQQSAKTMKPLNLYFGLLFLGLVVLVGCSGEAPKHTHNVNFHKPHDFIEAVDRLMDIHQAIVSDDPLPGPRKNVHSHSHDHDHGHSHSHGHSHGDDEDAEVGIFQELHDIVRWLPRISADSDIAEEEWNQVQGQIDAMNEYLRDFEYLSDEEKRTRYRAKQKEWHNQLIELQRQKTLFQEEDAEEN